MSELRESSEREGINDLASVVAELPPEPFGSRADKLRPAELPFRCPRSLGFVALAVSIASLWHFAHSLDTVVYVWTDAMGSSGKLHPSPIGWDYITGPHWQEGILFWPIYLYSAISTWLVECVNPAGARVATGLRWVLRFARILMSLACILAIIFYGLRELASGLAWAGPEYKEGFSLWFKAMFLMLLAIWLAGWSARRRPKIDYCRGFEVIPKWS